MEDVFASPVMHDCGAVVRRNYFTRLTSGSP